MRGICPHSPSCTLPLFLLFRFLLPTIMHRRRRKGGKCCNSFLLPFSLPLWLPSHVPELRYTEWPEGGERRKEGKLGCVSGGNFGGQNTKQFPPPFPPLLSVSLVKWVLQGRMSWGVCPDPFFLSFSACCCM